MGNLIEGKYCRRTSQDFFQEKVQAPMATLGHTHWAHLKWFAVPVKKLYGECDTQQTHPSKFGGGVVAKVFSWSQWKQNDIISIKQSIKWSCSLIIVVNCVDTASHKQFLILLLENKAPVQTINANRLCLTRSLSLLATIQPIMRMAIMPVPNQPFQKARA